MNLVARVRDWVEKEQNLGRCIRRSILTGDPSVCFSQQLRLNARGPKFLCLPAVLCRSGWAARMSQGFGLINVLAVWPVDVYKTALFARKGAGGVAARCCLCTRGTWRRHVASGRSQNCGKRLLLRHVCLHRTTRLPLDGCSWNWIYWYFSNFFRNKDIKFH